ncbi:MAG: STAS domain-containing protein [Maioricimonas sp. JB045]|uniref:STAS domain-containing protein n=1 Tax=Maioricimonas sp. JC845 TaxID=3232138 RepID=UPI003459800C
MTELSKHFHLYKRGKLTLIGFDARHLDDPTIAAECLDRLLELVDSHQCEVLVVDLMDVKVVSSWILGVLAAVKRHGIDVELYHPTAELRDVLATTHLEDLLHIRHDKDEEETC